jgi:glucosamine-phosphate N-acetyltransferase
MVDNLILSRLTDFDLLDKGFVETLSALKSVNLDHHQLFDVFASREATGIKTLIAILDKRIVGTISLFVEQKFINSGGCVGHIEDMAVHVDHQGTGIGRALVEYALSIAKKQNCYKVILDCSNEIIPFYEKLGFYQWQMAMRIDL